MNILPLSLTENQGDVTFDMLDTLNSLDVDHLHEVILNSHIQASEARPSLYTEEKAKMVEPSDYHFDFLNSKRPHMTLLSSNEELKEVADQLSVHLKERIEQSVHARAFKVLKKTLPDLSDLRQSTTKPEGFSGEEETELTTRIERFQEGYQDILDEVAERDEEFWKTVLSTEKDCEEIKKFWLRMLPEYKGNEAEFRKKIQQALFSVSQLFHKDKNDNKALLATQLNKKMVDHFFAMKQLRSEKFKELCDQWEQSTDDKSLLDKFIKLEAESVEALFEELRSQHHLHSLSRFQNLMSCHTQFINGMNYLFQAIESRCSDKTDAIKTIVSEMLLNASKDHSKKNNGSTATAYYRDVQGAAVDKTLSKADEHFNAKMALVFKKAMRNFQFIRRADAHTMPFPAAFSWNMDKLEQKFNTHSITLDRSLTKKRVSKEAFQESDKKLIVQRAIDHLGIEESDTGQFVWEAMSLIVGLALREASETELFPVFINSSLDGLSEAKLADKEFLKTIPTSTSSPEGDYKVILGQNLNQLLTLEKQVDEEEVFGINKEYMSRILNCLKYRINQISKQPIDKISLDEMYELRLMCDIWAVLEQVEEQYGQEIDTSIQLDWQRLQQWSEVTV